ncbi:MAG: ATP-binding protein [Candidatus Binatia bacterium]
MAYSLLTICNMNRAAWDSESGQSSPIETEAPSVPEKVEDTGLDFGFLADLTLKTVYSDTHCTTERAAEKLKLPLTITESLLQHLYREKLIEIRGLVALHNHRYAMLDRGWERVSRLLNVSGYIGPAPVSLASYNAMVQSEEKSKEPIKTESVQAALAHLVLPQSTIQTLGLVINSRRSLFMTGPSGNGKTSIAKALHSALGGEIWIPYAIEVDGQVIKVFDLHNHEPINPPPSLRYDQRWVKIKRPLVIVGGELTIETMDLIYSQTVRYYEAPFQMKSNGGTLVIDDFGRQRVDPRDLLNRWIIPLEGRVDYLTLHTGKKIQVPFEQLLLFATNLNPDDLVDDAFLRRMGYRLIVDPPDTGTYALILQRYVESHGLNYESKLLDLLLKRYEREKRQMKCCEPRDLIERCLDICRYEKLPLVLTPDLLELAWANYFGSKVG